jgi:hypothetical protein
LGECFEFERVPILRAAVADALVAAGMPLGSFELEEQKTPAAAADAVTARRARTLLLCNNMSCD